MRFISFGVEGYGLRKLKVVDSFFYLRLKRIFLLGCIRSMMFFIVVLWMKDFLEWIKKILGI